MAPAYSSWRKRADLPSAFPRFQRHVIRAGGPDVASIRPQTGSFATRPAYAVSRQQVRAVTRSCYKSGIAPHRILVHISRSEHRVLDPDDVYYLRARGGETEVRLRSRTPLVDVRPIGGEQGALDRARPPFCASDSTWRVRRLIERHHTDSPAQGQRSAVRSVSMRTLARSGS